MRDDCAYCWTNDGVSTPLVEAAGRRVCPIHSAKFIEEVESSMDSFVIVRRPELLDKGVARRW